VVERAPHGITCYIYKGGDHLAGLTNNLIIVGVQLIKSIWVVLDPAQLDGGLRYLKAGPEYKQLSCRTL
jgi:hypothetical protein